MADPILLATFAPRYCTTRSRQKTMWIQVQLNLATNWIVESLAMVALLKHL